MFAFGKKNLPDIAVLISYVELEKRLVRVYPKCVSYGVGGDSTNNFVRFLYIPDE